MQTNVFCNNGPHLSVTSGPFIKYVSGLGGRASSKIVTKCVKGEGVKQKSDVALSNFFYMDITQSLKV